MSFNFRAGSSNPFKSPSTPNRKGKGSLLSQGPSTTPAGPPPSYLTTKSTTPAGNPPRSSKIFGSSYNAANNTFGHRNTPGRRGRGFAVPESSPPRDEYEEDDDDEDADGEMVDEGYGTQTARNMPDVTMLSSMGMKDSPRGLKRSRTGEVRAQGESGLADIARSFARDHGPAPLDAPDDVVLETESISAQLNDSIHGMGVTGRDENITSCASRYSKLWSQYAKSKTRLGGIGPESEEPVSKANYIASLLLQLHHPHSSKRPLEPSTSRSQAALILQARSTTSSIPLPRALLDWLDTYHTPFPDDFNEVHLFRPSPAAHESFWDIIGAELLRGHFTRVVRLLTDAGFENAITAQDDGSRRPGYQGKQLENVEEVVDRYIAVLQHCPAVKDDDWDVKGTQWSVFRQRVRNAIKDLEAFATGSTEDEDTVEFSMTGEQNIFTRSANESNFGSMAAASVRAGSRVPWTIYENLKTMYGVLLGGDEIMDFAQDWVEASIFFTVWWDGDDGSQLNASLAGRSSLRVSRGPGAGTREVDVSPLTAYRTRLGQVFGNVTSQIEEPAFKPDSLDPVQVGLCCVMEDSIPVVIELLQAWNQSIAVAVTEIAALGGWLPQSKSSNGRLLREGLSSEDLMVLSHGPTLQGSKQDGLVSRDEVLSTYADLLTAKDVFRSSDGKVEREGWELGVSVLDRMDDRDAASAKISDILQSLQFHDETRVDKVLSVCSNMNLVDRAKEIAERYADLLLSSDENSKSYGLALIYYARAHAAGKLKDTLSFLTTLCLVQSAAVPANDSLDQQLVSLLSTDRAALVHLARVDPDAANLLGAQISGYATVRQFYNLRDNQLSGYARPLERQRKAGDPLIGVIESAADCIRGGLFDPDIESVVPVDGLLALLGEALPLLGQAKTTFSKQQVFALMRVVEDFDTAPGRIRERAVDVLQGAINAYRGHNESLRLRGDDSSGGSMSGSGLSGSSWDIVASSAMLHSQEKSATDTHLPDHRGWDWRKGLDAVTDNRVDGKETLMLLRAALAQEVAKGWAGGVGW